MHCPNVNNCTDTALDGTSVELGDDLVYTGVSYRKPVMPLGEDWGAFGTMQLAESVVSQAQADTDADVAANAAAANPVTATPSTIQQTCRFLPRDPEPIGGTEHTIGRERGCLYETPTCPEPILGEGTQPTPDEEFILGEGGEYIIGE